MTESSPQNGRRFNGIFLPVMVGLGGGAGGAIGEVQWVLAQNLRPIQGDISRLQGDFKSAQESLSRNFDRVTELEKHGPALLERFAEIETQFRQVTEYRNQQHEALEGRVSELWEVEFKRPMSRTTQYPVVGNGRK